MRISARRRAMSSASRSRWGLSPTTVCQKTLMPRAESAWEMVWALVLAMLPRSSSVPTAMSSAVCDMKSGPPEAGKPGKIDSRAEGRPGWGNVGMPAGWKAGRDAPGCLHDPGARRLDRGEAQILGSSVILTRIQVSPERASATRASTSRAASAARTSSSAGRVAGCRGVKTVQQSS